MPSPRVVLHVGTPKSGTTYLQDLLWHCREGLAEAGVSYPGDTPADHFHAAVELAMGTFNDHRDAAVTGAWGRLVEAARQHPGTTVISHELLGDLTAEQAAAVLADLDFAEVHVVVTARDLGRQLPAVWQEDLKNRHYLPFEDFLEAARPGSGHDVARPGPHGTEGHGATFWLRQDVAAVLRRWTADLPSERVHVVTVPPAGAPPALLWTRFAEVLGVDPSLATPPAHRANSSLGAAEADLLRRLNERLDYGLAWPRYAATVGQLLATAPGERSSAPTRLPGTDVDWVSRTAAAGIAELDALGCRVVGDLTDLRVQPAPGPATTPLPDPAEILEAALRGLTNLLRHEQPGPVPAGPPEDVLAGQPDDVPGDEPVPAERPESVDVPVDVPVDVVDRIDVPSGRPAAEPAPAGDAAVATWPSAGTGVRGRLGGLRNIRRAALLRARRSDAEEQLPVGSH